MREEAFACDGTELPFVIRQPIFDRDKAVWGYEFIAKDSLSWAYNDGATLSSLVDTHLEAMTAMGSEVMENKKVFLNIDHEAFLHSATMSDGWENCVFGVCGGAATSTESSCFADALHEQGGCVAIDCTSNDGDFEKAGKFDILKVSLAGKSPAEIVGIRKKYKSLDCDLLATDITSWETYEGTRALGFKYFQGPFFSLPQIKGDAQLSSSSVAKLQLFKELNNHACEMEQLAEIIATDVSLSYRILKYINSASFGMRNEVKSIQQAVSLLGLNELKHWTTLVVMADLDGTPKGEELAYLALQRGRFLSKLSACLPGFEYQSNTMFLLGLFSKLDALLGYPMDKALEDMPLDRDVKDALCGEVNMLRDWLLMLDAVEVGDWDNANIILSRFGASFADVAIQYMKASTWAAKQLPEMKNS